MDRGTERLGVIMVTKLSSMITLNALICDAQGMTDQAIRQCDEIEDERDEARAAAQSAISGAWIWQAEGNDLASMSDSMPVTLTAGMLRKMLAPAAAPGYVQDRDIRSIAAVRTLENARYEYLGGEVWRPPLGHNPIPEIDRLRERIRTLESVTDVLIQLQAETLEFNERVSAAHETARHILGAKT